MTDVPSRAEFSALTASVAQNTANIAKLQAASGAGVTPAPSPAPAPTTPDSTDLSKWKQTFTSDFQSSQALDPRVWQNDFYFGDRVLNSNGERQYYMNDGYTGDNGYNNPDGSHNLGINPFSFDKNGLHIQAAISDPLKSAHYWGYPYTSGLVTTEPSFSQTYGRFVASLKLPRGKGLWPAFWLLPVDKSWPPEADPLEAFGAPNANGEGGNTKIHNGMISATGSESNGGWIDVKVDVTAAYHEYALEWDKSHMTYYFDGKQIAQYPTPASFNKPMYMLCNLAVGGTWPGLPDNTTVFPAYLDVAFIRAYAAK